MAKIGLAGATAIGLGAIIGAGIFVLSGTAINLAGSGALIAFIFTGIIAVIIALELGELSSEMPKESGATYSFTYNAFGSELGFIGGILLYLGYVAGMATIALGFGNYLGRFVGITNGLIIFLFSVLLMIVLTFINYRGIKNTAKTDLALVVFKIAILLIFIIFAIYYGNWASAGINIGGFFSQGTGGIFAASVIALFAYAGFQSIASLTPDIEGGGRTAAKAIILSVIISMALYLGVTAALLSLVSPDKWVAGIADPLSFALNAVSAPQWLSIITAIGALVATTSATLSMMVGGSRTLFQMSVDGLLPKNFLKLNKNNAPAKSILITTVLGILILFSVLFVFSGNIYIIAAISNFGILFSFLLTGLALIKMRRIRDNYKEKKKILGKHSMVDFKHIFQMPFYPYLPIISIVAIIIFFYAFPGGVISTGLVVLLATMLIYYVMREIKNKEVIKVRFFD